MADLRNKPDVPEKDTPEGEKEEAPEKIKLGDEEYTQDELQSMVGLGKKAKSIEEKHGSLDDFQSDWGRKADAIGKLKKEVEELKKTKVAEKQATGQELSREEQVSQALAQAQEIGLVTKDNIRQYVSEYLEGKELLDNCRGLEEETDGKDGRPAFKTKEILDHMTETGIKNPERAYKDKFWDQLSEWERKQIKDSKPKGLVTESTSAAGGKQPKAIKVNKNNLEEMVREALDGNI